MSKELEYFIVEGGHDSDPDPEETGRIRTRQMGKHGPNVKTEHLPFNQTLKSGGNIFHRPPAPGTILSGYVPRGADQTGYAHLIGAFATKQEGGASVPGNTTLPFLDKAQNMELKIKLPPNIQSLLDSNRTGIEKFKKELQEKGERFKQATLRGLPSDGAVFPLSGVRNTPLKNISTALDSAVEKMTSSKLGGLSGLVSSLDLNSLISQLISQLSLPSNMIQSLESFVKTASGEVNSVSPSSGASLGNLVNQEKFLIKALDTLKDVKTTGELLRAIQTLQHPDTLADTLKDIEAIEVAADSIFGSIKQKINANGELENVANDFVENIKKALTSLLGGIPGTGIDGESYFTPEGTPIQELIQRMKDTAKATELKEAVEKVSSSMNQRKAKQRTQNNGSGKGATQDIIFKAKQLVARDGRIVPFNPTGSSQSAALSSAGGSGSNTPPDDNNGTGGDASAAFNQANAAFIQSNVSLVFANIALETAQAAFNYANTLTVGGGSGNVNAVIVLAQSAFSQANASYNTAVGAFTKSNTEATKLISAYDTINSESIRLTSAYSTVNIESSRLTSAFAQGNSALAVGQAAFGKANTAGNDASNAANIAIGAFAKGNSEGTRLTSAYGTINTESSRLTSAYNQSNNALSVAQGAFAAANAANATAESARLTSAFDQANQALIVGQAAFAKGNTEGSRLTSAYGTINTESSRLTSAFAQANGSLLVAQGAFAKANTYNASTEIIDDALPSRLRQQANTITDWNDAIYNGWYRANGANNAPTAATWYLGHVQVSGNSYLKQKVYAFISSNSSNTLTYARQLAGGVWGDWYLVQESYEEIGTQISAAIGSDSKIINAYAQANQALTVGQAAFAKGNTEGTRLTSAYATLNAESIRLTSAFVTANAANSQAQTNKSDIDTLNLFTIPLLESKAVGAYNQANSSLLVAQGAFAKANDISEVSYGTWTPTIRGSTTAGTYSYSTQTGYYSKVGRMVNLYFDVMVSSVTSNGTGTLLIAGIPYNSDAGNLSEAGTIGGWSRGNGILPASWAGWTVNYFNPSNVYILFFNTSGASGAANTLVVGANTRIKGSIFFRTSA